MNPVHPHTLFILMPGEVAVKRNSGKEDLPRWFSYPLEKIYAKICFSRRFRDFIYHRKPKAFLIFNVSFVEVLVALLFGRSSPIYSIYQWIPFEYLPWYKRVAYRLVLSRSRVIVVYNSIAEIYISENFFRRRKSSFNDYGSIQNGFLRCWRGWRTLMTNPIFFVPAVTAEMNTW